MDLMKANYEKSRKKALEEITEIEEEIIDN